MGIIQYDNIENVIRDIESVFDKHELDMEEKQLIIKLLRDRLVVQLQKQKTKDMVNNIPLNSLMKKIIGNKIENDD